jgi:hypothetical protein
MADAVRVDVRRSGRRFDAEAVLELRADPATTWATITDYAALPGFMPGIRACRVRERRRQGAGRERLVVEQEGEFRFLGFAQAMTVLLQVEHEAERVATARAVRIELGLMKQRAIEVFEGCYTLKPWPGGVQLHYRAVIGLALPPPPAIGSFAVRQNLAAQLQAVAREVARRSDR